MNAIFYLGKLLECNERRTLTQSFIKGYEFEKHTYHFFHF